MELKTLKDLKVGYLRETSPSIEVVSTKTLRQESIKWYKATEESLKESIERIGDYEEVVDWDKGAMAFIKKFFNLKDEDLI